MALTKGRPRSERCRAAILKATADLLEEQPYANVTMESIAERADVSKQTIYKWWNSRPRLAMEAYAARQGTRIPLPDTGAVRSDLIDVSRQTCRVLRRKRVGATFAGLIAEAQSDPSFATDFREQYIGVRRRVIATLLERGIVRGELKSNIDVPLVMDLLYGAIWYRLLLRNAPLNDAFADAVVDHVLASVLA